MFMISFQSNEETKFKMLSIKNLIFVVTKNKYSDF